MPKFRIEFDTDGQPFDEDGVVVADKWLAEVRRILAAISDGLTGPNQEAAPIYRVDGKHIGSFGLPEGAAPPPPIWCLGTNPEGHAIPPDYVPDEFESFAEARDAAIAAITEARDARLAVSVPNSPYAKFVSARAARVLAGFNTALGAHSDRFLRIAYWIVQKTPS